MDAIIVSLPREHNSVGACPATTSDILMPMNENAMNATWRRDARAAMREATLREAERRFKTRQPLFNYRWEHVKAVVSLAKRLADLTGADAEVVEAAAWLHDVRKDARERHPEEGASFAREFLAETDFPPEKIEQVAHVIAEHMGLWLTEPLTMLESQVLWDADKLAKIGLTAAFHWFGLEFAGHKSKTTEAFIHDGRRIEWQAKTVASMHTVPARRAAEKRLASYQRLWDELESELAGDDLLSS